MKLSSRVVRAVCKRVVWRNMGLKKLTNRDTFLFNFSLVDSIRLRDEQLQVELHRKPDDSTDANISQPETRVERKIFESI